MKTKLVFCLCVLLASIKVTAQSNEQEAVLTYKLAMEEYDKGNFDKALPLFDHVLKLDNKSEAKVAYMKVKCSENFLFKDIEDENLDSRDDDYLDCMSNIETYIKKGSDENRKNELLRLKIKIENTNIRVAAITNLIIQISKVIKHSIRVKINLENIWKKIFLIIFLII